jgi:SPOR domain
MSDESGDGGDQSHAPDQGTADQRDPGADALKALARLIGQTDSLSTAGHPEGNSAPGGRLADVLRGASSPTAAGHEPFARPPAREQAQSQDRPREDRSHADQTREDRSAEDRFRQQRPLEGRPFAGRSSLERGAPVRREPDFARSRAPVQPDHSDAGHAETPAENFDFLQLPDRDDYAVAPQHPMPNEEDYRERDHRESSLSGRRDPSYGQEHEDYADEYHEDEYGLEEESEYQAEHEEPDDGETGVKRRSTTKVVVAVLGLAVFGTAAAFGYRTIFKADPSGPTPIIRADNSPTKIAPVAADANARPASGLFDDRSREQLVRREEEPINVAAPSYGSGAAGGGAVASAPPVMAPAAASPPLLGDPKRVRTVPIRADEGEASSSDRPASRSVPPPQSQPSQQPQARPPSPPRQVAVPPPPPQTPLPSPSRQVAAAPAPAAPSPSADTRLGTTRVATAPEPAASRAIETGGFVVQVSSQRSETDAQAAFRTLQTKYPVLSGREPLIRRKDLGERGIFFAAQVGPFGAKSEADQLCETLRTAGGACFVQKN